MFEHQRSFTAGDAARLTGVSYRTLDFWAKSGFVEPSVAPARGTGTQRRYSFDDLIALRVAHYLRRGGVSLQALRRVIAYLRARHENTSFASCFLVTDGCDVYEVHGGRAISTLLKPGQLALAGIIDLDTLVAELRAAVAGKT